MRTLRILIVDDDDDFAESLAEFIRLDGHRVDLASTGVAGVAAAAAADHDLVLIDVGLPDVDGVRSMRAIRKTNPAARVVLITGHSRTRVLEEARPGLTAEVLTKPLDLEALTSRLAALAVGGESGS